MEIVDSLHYLVQQLEIDLDIAHKEVKNKDEFIEYLIAHCIQKDYPTATRESLFATFEYHKQSLK